MTALNSPQEPREVHLPTVLVTPFLSDQHRIGSQLKPVPLRHAEPGHHRAVVAVHRHQRPRAGISALTRQFPWPGRASVPGGQHR
jgi:hypothetical protein